MNLWSIPNISLTIWEALVGLLYISMGDANNLLEMYYITPRRMTKLATAQSDENKPNRTLQFHGDTARCNKVTLWFSPLLVTNFNAIQNVKGANVKKRCQTHYVGSNGCCWGTFSPLACSCVLFGCMNPHRMYFISCKLLHTIFNWLSWTQTVRWA